jgi:hypothetical protein
MLLLQVPVVEIGLYHNIGNQSLPDSSDGLICVDAGASVRHSSKHDILRFRHLLICKACLRYAEELKAEGNDHYRAGSWKEALAAYRSGLGGLPARIKKKRQEDLQAADADSPKSPVEEEEEEDQQDTQITDGENVDEHDEYSKTRAALHANIAACYVKLVSVRSCGMLS